MKKLSFLGVVVFAFQSMSMAQTVQQESGVSLTTGSWQTMSNNSSISNSFAPFFGAGFYFNYPIGGGFLIKTRLNYTFLTKNGGYKTGSPFYVGDGESASYYHHIAIPLEIGMRLKKFTPSIGIEGSYRASESWLKQHVFGFGFTGSLNYVLSDKISIALNYSRGLTKDLEFKGTFDDPNNTLYSIIWKSSRIGVTMFFKLNHNCPCDDTKNVTN